MSNTNNKEYLGTKYSDKVFPQGILSDPNIPTKNNIQEPSKKTEYINQLSKENNLS